MAAPGRRAQLQVCAHSLTRVVHVFHGFDVMCAKRFCDSEVRGDAAKYGGWVVCASADCQRHASQSCTASLSCGHVCCGTIGENIRSTTATRVITGFAAQDFVLFYEIHRLVSHATSETTARAWAASRTSAPPTPLLAPRTISA